MGYFHGLLKLFFCFSHSSSTTNASENVGVDRLNGRNACDYRMQEKNQMEVIALNVELANFLVAADSKRYKRFSRNVSGSM